LKVEHDEEQAVKLITIDFETAYSKEYSLSKMTTESYVRSEQFEVIGFAVKLGDAPARWCTGNHSQLATVLKFCQLDKNMVLAHNAAFDMAILNWHFDIRPAFILDTLSMARPLHNLTVGGSLKALAEHYGLGAKGTEVLDALGKWRKDFTKDELAAYGRYCVNDVELTYQLFKRLAHHIPKAELKIIDLMVRMFTEPVIEIDAPLLQEHLAKLEKKKEALLHKVTELVGDLSLASNPQFAKILEQLGVPVPMKISLRTGKPAPALSKKDVEFKALEDHEDERVQMVVAARLGTKSTQEETRTKSFLGVAERGPLPIMLNYYGAHTGRASGGEGLNLQNLPSRDPTKLTLRRSLIAPAGHSLVACDSSQIEARVVAYLAGQDDLVKDFQNGEDIYSKFATDLYGTPISKANKIERTVGKTCVAEGTLVLSDRGWKPIEQVSLHDKLWDGEEWVCHKGLLNNGTKPTLPLCGTWLTPDHQVWSGTQWLEAQSVVADENILYQALDIGAENLPSQAMYVAQEWGLKHLSCSATALNQSTPLTTTISKILKVLDALCAPRKRLLQSAIGCTAKQWQMIRTGLAYSIVSLQRSLGVIRLQTEHINITDNGEFKYAICGAVTEPSSYATSKLLRGGTTLISRWIESTLMDIMSRGISASYREAITSKTNAKSQTSKPVYDILNCGSRNRFTILTEAGPLIVHNCILGLGYGMGKDKLQATLKTDAGIELSVQECEKAVALYRQKYGYIVNLWSDSGIALSAIAQGSEITVGTLDIRYADERVYLPNGLFLAYPNIRQEEGQWPDGRPKKQYVYDKKRGRSTERVYIYGGKAVENKTQALARIIVFDQMAEIAKRYKVVLTVHDEVVCCVPDEEVDQAVQFMESVMRTAPRWAPGLPIACESSVGKNYAECK
jgi:DNA polymerase I-like protein with 3'-5' exonuclease and polymerase domains